MKNISISLLLTIFFTYHLLAQNKIDSYLNEVLGEGAMPGFSVIIVNKEGVLFEKGFGFAKITESKPMTAQTVTAIGSLTKSFTTFAIMQLVEKGKIDLDAPVTVYLPTFRTANKEKSDLITVRMLLNNTAGLKASIPRKIENSTKSMERLLSTLKGTYLSREPGTTYEYSNTDFAIAGMIINKVSGMPLEQYFEQNIFKPLQMTKSTTDPQYFERLEVLYGHYLGLEEGIPAKPEPFPTEMMGAGSLMRSNAKDLGNYLTTLLNGGIFNGKRILQEKSIKEMWSPNISFPGLTKEDGGDGKDFQYGLGWMLSEIEGRQIVHHGGSRGTMSSFTLIDLKSNTAVSILVNLDYTFVDKYRYANLLNITNNLLHLANAEPLSNYAQPTAEDPSLNDFNLPNTALDKYVGLYKFAKGGDNWMLFGVDMQIYKSKEQQLYAKLTRGKQTIMHFKLDFVNTAYAVSRHLGNASPCQFIINPNGEISGAFFSGIEFTRQKQLENLQNIDFYGQGYIAVPDNWQANVLNGIIELGYTKQRRPVKIEIFKDERNTQKEACSILLKDGKLVYEGKLHTLQKGEHIWQSQSLLTSNNKNGQQAHQLLWRDGTFIKVTTHPSILTLAVQEAMPFLLEIETSFQ